MNNPQSIRIGLCGMLGVAGLSGWLAGCGVGDDVSIPSEPVQTAQTEQAEQAVQTVRSAVTDCTQFSPDEKAPDYIALLMKWGVGAMGKLVTARQNNAVSVGWDVIQSAITTLAQDPTMRTTADQIAEVKKELDCVAQGLDWDAEAFAQNDQWSALNGAWMEAQEVGFPRGSFYDGSSHDATLAAGGLIMFSRLWIPGSTAGGWDIVFRNYYPPLLDASLFNGAPGKGPTTDHVFDWRVGLPWFTKAVASRLIMIAEMDPQFDVDHLWDAELEGTQDFPGYRVMLQQRLSQMLASIGCSYGGGHSGTTFVCADFNTGVAEQNPTWIDYFTVTPDVANPIYGNLYRQLLRDMSVFQVQSMIDSLYRFTHPAPDLSAAFHRIPLVANAGLCLDAGNGARGTPLSLGNCDGRAGEQLFYDRDTQTIRSDAFGWCLGVEGGYLDPGTPVITWDCDGTDSQRWTYDPEQGVLSNALGNVLDVEWGNLSAGQPVWTWPLNYSGAQLWRADHSSTYCSGVCYPQCSSNCASAGPYTGQCMGGCMGSCVSNCMPTWP
jgi:hypothetical protein